MQGPLGGPHDATVSDAQRDKTFCRLARGKGAAVKGTACSAVAAFLPIVFGVVWYPPLAAHAQQIILVGELDPVTTRHYYDVWGEGDYAYIATQEPQLGCPPGGGVAIIDILDPTSPFLAAVYNPGTVFLDLKVHDGIGYFPSQGASGHVGTGLHIVDLSDPTLPSLISQVTSKEGGFDRIHNVFYSNGFLYEADDRTNIIKALDVSDPNNPFLARDIVTPGLDIHDITVINNRLYASERALGLTYVYDVSDIGSTAPTLLTTIPTGGLTHSSWVTSDDQILISARETPLDGGVNIYDISDLNNPVLLSSITQASIGIPAVSPHNPVLYSDDLLFIAWNRVGVVALDITNPSAPILVGHFEISLLPENHGGIWGVYPLLGLDRVLLSHIHKGLFIVDARCTESVQPQDKDQQRCINALNKGLADVGRAQGKEIRKCIKRGSKGQLDAQTIEQCSTATNNRKIAKAKRKTLTRASDNCSVAPDFGPADPNAINQVAMQKELSLLHRIFGSDLDSAIIPKETNPVAGHCQVDVSKAVHKCRGGKLKEFNRCKRARLKNGTCAFGLVTCMGQDPKGRSSRACDPASGKIRTTIDKKCTGSGVSDLSAAFPGCGTDDPGQLAACLDVFIECSVCRGLNEADALDRDCDLFDDRELNSSCP